jgi:hypothetical protein
MKNINSNGSQSRPVAEEKSSIFPRHTLCVWKFAYGEFETGRTQECRYLPQYSKS